MLSDHDGDGPVGFNPAPSAPPAAASSDVLVAVGGAAGETAAAAAFPSVASFSGFLAYDEDEEPSVAHMDSFYPKAATSPRYEPPALPREEEGGAGASAPPAAGFTAELPPLRTAPGRPSLVPAEATPFLGVVSAGTGGTVVAVTSAGSAGRTSSSRNYGTVTIADLDGRPSPGAGKPQPSPVRTSSTGQQLPPGVQPPQPPPELRPRPWFGYAMALSCLAGFIVSIVISSKEPGTTIGFAPLDINPLFGPMPQALVKTGAKVTALIIPPSNQWWRLVTPLWLHAGIVHLLANGHMLIKMGWELERGIGSFRFACLYILSSIFSMSASALFSVPVVTVGASGALFGVLGAILAELCCNQHLLTPKERCKHFLGIGITILINLAVGIFPLVDNFAHLGGLVGGILLGTSLIMHRDPRRKNKLKFRQVCCGVFSAILFVLLQALMIVCLYLKYDAAVFCPWCKYVSCVPIPAWQCYYQQTP